MLEGVMTLEAAYWLALAVGLGLLVLSLLLGDLFDFLDFLTFDFLGSDFSAAPVFFTATGAFGAGGLLGLNAFGLGTGGSILSGLGCSVILGSLAGLLFAALRRQESKEGFVISQLVGARGRCTLAIEPRRTGRVSIHHAGMTRSLPATSTDPVASGEEIVVVDTIGSTLSVERAGKQAPSDSAT
jgi:membrane protein implicated in regulation of membrane protease activity